VAADSPKTEHREFERGKVVKISDRVQLGTFCAGVVLPLACSAGFGVPNALVLVFPNALDAPPKAEAGFPNNEVVVPVAAGVVELPPAVLAAADGKPKRFPLVVVDDPLPNRFLSVMAVDERETRCLERFDQPTRPHLDSEDGTQSVWVVQRRSSDTQTTQDGAADLQGMFFPRIRDGGAQHHHRGKSVQTRRSRSHRGVGGKRCRERFRFVSFVQHSTACVVDSTVLAYVMKTLNERYDYGLQLFLLSIDEGITGYRDDSLEVSFPCR
jgi:hypothetical protein